MNNPIIADNKRINGCYHNDSFHYYQHGWRLTESFDTHRLPLCSKILIHCKMDREGDQYYVLEKPPFVLELTGTLVSFCLK